MYIHIYVHIYIYIYVYTHIYTYVPGEEDARGTKLSEHCVRGCRAVPAPSGFVSLLLSLLLL